MAITKECCEQYWTSPEGSNPKKQQLYGHLPLITKTIQVRRTRHPGHCWRSGDELIIDILLWTPLHGRAITGRPARTYIQQLYADTGCSPEDLPEAMETGGRSVLAARHDDDQVYRDFGKTSVIVDLYKAWLSYL